MGELWNRKLQPYIGNGVGLPNPSALISYSTYNHSYQKKNVNCNTQSQVDTHGFRAAQGNRRQNR